MVALKGGGGGKRGRKTAAWRSTLPPTGVQIPSERSWASPLSLPDPSLPLPREDGAMKQTHTIIVLEFASVGPRDTFNRSIRLRSPPRTHEAPGSKSS